MCAQYWVHKIGHFLIIMSVGWRYLVLKFVNSQFFGFATCGLRFNFTFICFIILGITVHGSVQSQYPSMEDHGLQYELSVVEFMAIDYGLQENVIVL